VDDDWPEAGPATAEPDVRRSSLSGTVVEEVVGEVAAEFEADDEAAVGDEEEVGFEVVDAAEPEDAYPIENMLGVSICTAPCGKLITANGLDVEDEDEEVLEVPRRWGSVALDMGPIGRVMGWPARPVGEST
jgi:hypothetical protein